MIEAVVSIGGIGMLAAVTLGFAAKKFAVKVDPRLLEILDVLPGANCGACGYPGCSAYAQGVASGEASASLCTPGGAETIEQVAQIMGVAAETCEPQVAVVLCQGNNRKAKDKYRYLGINDCQAAQRLADGPKVCPSGCIGLGTCMRVCPFGAIEMTSTGLAVISWEKCTGCGKCVSACPRGVISTVPSASTVQVLCNSHDKGAVVRKYCEVGCIACLICEKMAPEAFHLENFLAVVRLGHNEEALEAVAKCPTKCIRDFSEGYPDGVSFTAPVVKSKRAA
jgi:H+/Na+-translocating ferredoxin:NAD+ oxidoreductase subunit B